MKFKSVLSWKNINDGIQTVSDFFRCRLFLMTFSDLKLATAIEEKHAVSFQMMFS